MARIKKEDVFDPKLFTGTTQEITKMIEVVKALKQELLEVLKVSQQALKGNKSMTNAEDIKKQANAINQVTQAEKNLTTVEKERIRLESRLAQARSKESQDSARIKLLIQEENRAKKERARETTKELGAYKNLSAKLNRLRTAYKNLAAAEKQNTKEGRALLKQITKLDVKLKTIDGSVGQFQRNVGNYGNALKKMGSGLRRLAAGFGIFAGVSAFANLIKKSFRSIVDFQKANSDLAAVLGKTRKEIKNLTRDAKRLGSTTRFTASQVTKLQKEFAKLGFSTEEILGVTEATLTLATATNTELPRSAEIVGNTLRAFQLDSSQTTRLVDVMTKSFNTSALDMEKFSTAMSTVAPIARNFGFDIERTTAILGVLADNGIDASTSGTALRNIFLELAKSGKSFEGAMKEINESTNKNAKALDLFGKRGAAVGTIIAQNTDKIEDLNVALIDSGGTAEQVADEQMNTLQGAMYELTSAWEGFIFSIESGDGVISKALNSIVKGFTTLLNKLTELNMTTEELIEKGVVEASKSAEKEIDNIAVGYRKASLQINKSNEELLKELSDWKKFKIVPDEFKDNVPEFQRITVDLLKMNRKNLSVEEQKLRLLRRQTGQIVETSLAENLKDLKNPKRIKVLKEQLELEKEKLAVVDEQVAAADGSIFERGYRAVLKDFVQEGSKASETFENIEKSNDELALQWAEQKLLVKQYADELAKSTKAVEVIDGELRNLFKSMQKDELRKLVKSGTLRKYEQEIADIVLATKDLNKAHENSDDATKGAAKREAARIRAEKKRLEAIKKAAQKQVDLIEQINQEEFKQAITSAEDLVDEEIAIQVRKGLAVEDVNVEAMEELIKKEFVLRKNAMELIAEAEIMKEGKTKEEIELIRLKLKGDLEELEKDKAQTIIDANDEVIEAQIEGANRVNKKAEESAKKQKELAAERIERQKELAESLNATLDILQDRTRQRTQERIALMDDEISAARKRQEELKRLAEQGNIDAQKSLAVEEAREKELQLKKLKAQRRQQYIDAALSGFKAYASKVEQGSKTPLRDTIKDLSGLAAFIKTLPTFYEGTENVGEALGTPQIAGKDGYIVRVDAAERIVDPQTNKKLGGISNNDLGRMAENYRNREMRPIAYSQISERAADLMNNGWKTNEAVLQKFDKLEQSTKQITRAIKNMPSTEWNYDQMSDAVVQKVRTLDKVEQKHYRNGALFSTKK
jgi:hypothetical protein